MTEGTLKRPPNIQIARCCAHCKYWVWDQSMRGKCKKYPAVVKAEVGWKALEPEDVPEPTFVCDDWFRKGS